MAIKLKRLFRVLFVTILHYMNLGKAFKRKYLNNVMDNDNLTSEETRIVIYKDIIHIICERKTIKVLCINPAIKSALKCQSDRDMPVCFCYNLTKINELNERWCIKYDRLCYLINYLQRLGIYQKDD